MRYWLAALLFIPFVASAQSGVDREVSWINATSYTDSSPMPVGTFDTVIVVNGVEAARVPSTVTNITVTNFPWGESEVYAYHVDNNGVVGMNSNVVVTFVQPIPEPPAVTVTEVLAALRDACEAPGNPAAFRDVCILMAALR
jgi:hypothetical protein